MKIVTDCAADMPNEELERLGIIQRDRTPIEIGKNDTVFPPPPGMMMFEQMDHHVAVDPVEGQQDRA